MPAPSIRLLFSLALALCAGRLDAQIPQPPTVHPPPGRPPIVAAPVSNADLPDPENDGAEPLRVDDEERYELGPELADSAWRYLVRRYTREGDFLNEGGRRFSARASDEYFVDRYFDTPELWFLGQQAGIRHRSRFIPGDTSNEKDGRELMQVKTSVAGAAITTRSEFKFDIRHYPVARNREDAHPVLGIVKRDQRGEFRELLASLGVDPFRLRHVLTLRQRRQRVYIGDQYGPFFTVTIDHSRSRKWWLTQGFTEVELELNEIRYSAAEPVERAFMEHIRDEIRADLFRAFPSLVQDQTPKYPKIFARFEAALPLFELAVRQSLQLNRLAGMALTAVMAMLVLAAWLKGRRAREGKAPESERVSVVPTHELVAYRTGHLRRSP